MNDNTTAIFAKLYDEQGQPFYATVSEWEATQMISNLSNKLLAANNTIAYLKNELEIERARHNQSRGIFRHILTKLGI